MTTKPKTTASSGSKKEENAVEYYKKHVREYKIIKGGGIFFSLGKSEYSYYDKDTGKVFSFRYCPGESGIIKDNQNESSAIGNIVFSNGRLFVPPSQPNLAEFLDKHPKNEANGGSVFKMVDYVGDAKKVIEDEFNIVDALVLIRTKPMEDLLSVATSLGINTDRLSDEIKHDLTVYAKRNPVSFVQMFDDPSTKVKSDVKKAMSFGIITTNGGYVRWSDTNNHIIAVPEGKDAVDVFVRYCLTEAGSPVYEEIKRQLS